MADVSERTLQVAVVVSFAAGFLAGWQANRMRRKFLDWRKKRLQDKLSETQKKLDLAWMVTRKLSRHIGWMSLTDQGGYLGLDTGLTWPWQKPNFSLVMKGSRVSALFLAKDNFCNNGNILRCFVLVTRICEVPLNYYTYPCISGTTELYEHFNLFYNYRVPVPTNIYSCHHSYSVTSNHCILYFPGLELSSLEDCWSFEASWLWMCCTSVAVEKRS